MAVQQPEDVNMTNFMKRAAAAAVLIAALPFSAEAFPIATAPAAQTSIRRHPADHQT